PLAQSDVGVDSDWVPGVGVRHEGVIARTGGGPGDLLIPAARALVTPVEVVIAHVALGRDQVVADPAPRRRLRGGIQGAGAFRAVRLDGPLDLARRDVLHLGPRPRARVPADVVLEAALRVGVVGGVVVAVFVAPGLVEIRARWRHDNAPVRGRTLPTR